MSAKKKFKFLNFNIFWMYAIIAIALIGVYWFDDSSTTKEVSYADLTDYIQRKQIQSIVVDRRAAEAEAVVSDSLAKELLGNQYKPNTATKVSVKIPTIDDFSKKADEWVSQGLIPGNRIEYKEKTDYTQIMWMLPIILFIGVWIYIMRRMSSGRGMGGNGGIFNVGKSKATIYEKEGGNQVHFSDVAGLTEAKTEVAEIVEFLKNPSRYTDIGGKIPKGALLVGPPGTGKTLLAKAVAGEANVPFFSLSGSDFVEMFVGVGPSRVRDLFRQAKDKAPCIVFIDEIDAVGRARGRNPNFGANDERENTLNQLLTEMDGFGSNSGVIVLAATNRADILDKALLRAGRFDRQITVDLPELPDRVEIFKVHLKNIKVAENIDIEFLARQTPGFSGADIANVCNEAALIAARHDKKAVDRQDFSDAIDRIVGGLERHSRIYTGDEKRAIAIHEAGHATVSWFIRYGNPLVKVTIVPRGRAGGATIYAPDELAYIPEQAILDTICGLLAGRAAEDTVLGYIGAGASNDLKQATRLAYTMVAHLGMSPRLPNINYEQGDGAEYQFGKPYSEERARIIDEEVSKILECQYQRAKDIINDHLEAHRRLFELLVEREVIVTADVEAILGKRQWTSRNDELYPAQKDHGENIEDVEAVDISPEAAPGDKA